MADIVDKATRSRMMSGIRSRDTRPEFVVRKGLHSRGLRYRLHVADLPGKPDLVFPRYGCAVFVHGCFWHGHGCRHFRWPTTNVEFWKKKILSNRKRDRKVLTSLKEKGWRLIVAWECEFRGKKPEEIETKLSSLYRAITNRKPTKPPRRGISL